MKYMNDAVLYLPGMEALKAKLNKEPKAYALCGLTNSAKLHVLSALKEGFKFTLIIADSDSRAGAIKDELGFYDRTVTFYPGKDLMFYHSDIKGNELTIERMKSLRRIIEGKPTTLVTTFGALMTHQVPLDVLKSNIINISKTSIVEEKALSKKLINIGYEKVYQVEHPGEFSVRGGIVDIYELTEENPYRIELWGDEVDSLRSFDVESQRSIEQLESVSIFPACDIILSDDELNRGLASIEKAAKKYSDELRALFKTEEAHRVDTSIRELIEEAQIFHRFTNLDAYLDFFYDRTSSLIDFFKNDKSVIFIDEPLRVNEQADAIETEFRENMIQRLQKGYILPGQEQILYSFAEAASKLSHFAVVTMEELPMHSVLKDEYLEIGSVLEVNTKPIAPFNNSFETLTKELAKYKKEGYRVLLLSLSKTRAQRLAKDLQDSDFNAFYSESTERELQSREIETSYGFVSKGFEYPDIKLCIISETDIFGSQKKNKRRKKFFEGASIKDFNELSVGDYVVHEYHGLGIYRGIEKIEADKVTKDYVKIEYRDQDYLYVLATDLSVLMKYASADAKKPKLNKIGSKEWSNTKNKVKTATLEIAKELVELYAVRQNTGGYSYGKDTIWQKEFEEMFPYEETEDQLRAIEDTKKDMESTKIMDRLICGDVGFGKTEVAIRAAFKAVQEGKQVVYLVPTTILAQQHFDTFSERMKNFPVRVELLSRFRTPSEIKKTIEDLKKGFVDIVIGTHRVLSADVAFKDLGLLIIDEEQRFGVAHKEKIKQMKESVDVLTLSATPIPRTLHMSLIGIRDMSLLEDPPQERQPIQTYVMEYNEELVREAIVREISRGGQVYYVYNKVNTIADIASNIEKLVPEARVAYAHGQMVEKELEYIMYQFINHEIDVLVSTTIIETGLDISNVNTMIIHDSDRMGLSQLYQLRGRVGRSNRTAYAFLMYKQDRLLKEEAEKRLSAIKEFTELGSGYKIAMKDLEIRGAGNILGKTQHGHMQAVGYDLYCKMLNDAVKTLKGIEVETDFDTLIDLDVDAYIPAEYIVNEVQKLDIYKRIAELSNNDERTDMESELKDRFGNVPKCVENLLRISMIRVDAHKLYLTDVKGKNGEIVFIIRPDAKINPEGIPKVIAAFERFSFNPKTFQFIIRYQRSGMAEKDERTVLELTEKVLHCMKEELLKTDA